MRNDEFGRYARDYDVRSGRTRRAEVRSSLPRPAGWRGGRPRVPRSGQFRRSSSSRPRGKPEPPRLECSACGCGSTSPTTAARSTAGPRSRGCARFRATWRRPWRTVLRTSEVSVVCAGRTDTGVHARGQVVHLDVEPTRSPRPAGRRRPRDALARRLNGVLPADLRVRRVVAAPDGFDARFSPLWRRYAYRVADGVARPAHPRPRPRLAASARPRRDERGVGRAARAPRLRGLLQAARGRDDDPHAARPRLGPRRRPA